MTQRQDDIVVQQALVANLDNLDQAVGAVVAVAAQCAAASAPDASRRLLSVRTSGFALPPFRGSRIPAERT